MNEAIDIDDRPQQDSKYGYIDKNGTMVVAPRWHDAKRFSCGLAAVKTDAFLTGFIDHEGKVMITPLYWGAYAFERALLGAEVEGRQSCLWSN